MTSSFRKHRARRERGVAMVEFMIVLPLILFLMFAITEIGRVMIRYNALTKSLQDGARHAAAYALLGTSGSVFVDGALDSEIRNLVVFGDAQGGTDPLLEGFTTGQVEITVPQPGWVRVEANYPYVPAMGSSLPSFGFGSSPTLSFDLSASVSMRAL